MTTGTFILSVRKTGAKDFGEISRFPYDDAAPRKAGRRDAMLEDAKVSQDGWQRRVAGFSDASFRIEEDVNENGTPKRVISGTPYGS